MSTSRGEERLHNKKEEEGGGREKRAEPHVHENRRHLSSTKKNGDA